MAKKLSFKELAKKGIPAVLIPGIIFASLYGSGNIEKIKNYYEAEVIFPKSGIVEVVEDGDTFYLKEGQKVRMLGINAPDRGKEGYLEAKDEFEKLVWGKRVWLEYDRYQNDKYGRILAWVWIECESPKPRFEGANYMFKNGKESKDYIEEKAEGCEKGELVNKYMVEKDMAESVNYGKRGRLKYEL